MILNHLQLIVKGTCVDFPRSEEELSDWLIDLIEIAGMEKIEGSTSIHIIDLGNNRLTGTILLNTSHANLHIWGNGYPGYFQFDIYNCKEFITEDIITHLQKFNLLTYDFMLIDRNDIFKILETGDFKKNDF